VRRRRPKLHNKGCVLSNHFLSICESVTKGQGNYRQHIKVSYTPSGKSVTNMPRNCEETRVLDDLKGVTGLR
jgi:hypothetical protein